MLDSLYDIGQPLACAPQKKPHLTSHFSMDLLGNVDCDSERMLVIGLSTF